MHVACPVSLSWYCPAGHATQWALVVVSVPLPNLPAAHATHATFFWSGWYWPIGHAVHVSTLDVLENVPSGHTAHSRLVVLVCSTSTRVPGAHAVAALQTCRPG
jgi:hypothetical protein